VDLSAFSAWISEPSTPSNTTTFTLAFPLSILFFINQLPLKQQLQQLPLFTQAQTLSQPRTNSKPKQPSLNFNTNKQMATKGVFITGASCKDLLSSSSFFFLLLFLLSWLSFEDLSLIFFLFLLFLLLF